MLHRDLFCVVTVRPYLVETRIEPPRKSILFLGPSLGLRNFSELNLSAVGNAGQAPDSETAGDTRVKKIQDSRR